MPKGTRGGRRTATAAATAATVMSNIPTNAQPMTDAQADALRQQQDSTYDANTTAAVKMYISDTDFDKDGHSLSQTMNYLLDNGVDLNNADVNTLNKQYNLHLTARDLASMQYTNNYMEVAMHNLGQDTILQRGAHDDMLRNAFGINDYSKLSQSQLQARLVGQAFQTDSYMSTSYDINKNPFLAKGSAVAGGREVIYNIKAGANTQCLFGAKKQSEIILNKGTQFKITGVRYNGNTATPRGKGMKPQIVIDIETV